MENDIERSSAIIYDLLTQEGSLSRPNLKLLQTQLRVQGIDTGKIDGFMGNNTGGALGEFLRRPDNRAFVDQISPTMRKSLDRYGQKALIERIEYQNSLGNEGELNINVLENLENENLSRENIGTLQKSLNELGYHTGGTKGYFGENTASGVMEYLKDNPGALATIEPSILHEVMKNGQTSELKELLSDPNMKDMLDTRINETLVKLGADGDIGALNTTADYASVRDLQTLLNIGGYASGGVDGIVGNRTLDAVGRYEATIGAAEDATLATEAVETMTSATPEPIPVPVPKPKPDQELTSTNSFTASASIPQTQGVLANGGYTTAFSGTNKFGVDNRLIEQSWANVTVTSADDRALAGQSTVDSHSLAGNERPLIVIDLGHKSDFSRNGSGNDIIDPGAVSKHVDGPIAGMGLSEVDVVDPVGLALAENLHEMGYNVAFTRNVGEQLRLEGTHGDTLRVRSDFANELAHQTGSNGVMFISLHANSVESSRAHGSRIYHDVDGAGIVNDGSKALAQQIAGSYSIDGRNSAVKHVGDLAVLDRFENHAAAPTSSATLVELGFLSNPEDAQALKHMSENPDDAAKQIAAGINNHVLSITPELSTSAQQLNNQGTVSSSLNLNLN